MVHRQWVVRSSGSGSIRENGGADMAEAGHRWTESVDLPKIAVADWDNTMRRGFTMSDWVSFLAVRDLFPAATADRIRSGVAAYQAGESSYQVLAETVTELYAAGLAGQGVAAVATASHDFVRADEQNLYRFVRPMMRRLRELGLPLIVVSGCPTEPLRAYGDQLEISEVYGLAVRRAGGRYLPTLDLNPTLAEEKSKVVAELAARAQIALALGDSAADLPLLEAAANRVLVGDLELPRPVDGMTCRVRPSVADGEPDSELIAVLDRAGAQV
jgi:phosphoserine phosphatase